MKNYYVQLSELRVAETRLETLKEKKVMLEARITSTTSKLQEVTVHTNSNNDKMTEYTIECERLNKQIAEMEEEVEILRKGVKKMDDFIKNISGIEERIFRLYYIENKNPTQISFIIPCDRKTVYRYLKKLNEKYEVKRL